MTAAFRNPIVPGDYPDPSIVRVGDDYYMVTSTFQFFPGVPVMHSKDLVHWETIGHVIMRREQLDLVGIPDSFGVFAPDISYADGKFWVVVPYYHGRPRCTNILYVADRPEGPYSEGVPLNHHFIDPSIFHDDDGRKYLAFGGGWVHELAADGSGLVGEAKQVWPGTGGAAPEAPHLVKRNGWYYLMLAEGGTFFDHMETVARSKSVWGPYEPCPHNPVLKQRDPERRLQRAGHGKLVEAPDGRWFMVHLGGRPLTPGGDCPLGRETFLADVAWTDDGWFVVGEDGAPQETVTLDAPAGQPLYEAGETIDRFDGPRLSPEWEWVRHPLPGGYALTEAGLEIRCLPFIPYSPQETLIATRRWRHLSFVAETSLTFEPASLGEEAGLVMYRDTDGYLAFTVRRGVGQTSGQMFDVKRLHEVQEHDGLFVQVEIFESVRRKTLALMPLSIGAGDRLALRVELDEADGGAMRLSYSEDGKAYAPACAPVPAAFLYPDRAPRFHCFTAPRVGVFARGVYGTPHGRATFEQFTYRWGRQR
ncbi:glycoside hydrolase family 43 protein [Paenibacillus sp.]|uniref:glycoside hydrolase family 43 protein n=1 Tax=Paenibacillus sp. TaxID=58172 RepID=UPI002D449ABA|nr:glycoside hydrolase family 43 protein [Paenibacillus sp.]HZG58786.1 glycoside hydrolase family 43 protein [Paenibacillus sp.]